MEESTRTLIAYASLLIGFPIIAAKLVWCIPSAIATPVLTRIAGGLDLFVDATAEGFISFLLTRQLFELLQLSVVWQVPLTLILVIWLQTHFRQGNVGALPYVLGIIVGILFYPGGLAYPSIPLIARMWIQ